jgi:hypothetical protein
MVSPREPLLSPKKVALVWMASLVILYQMMILCCHGNGCLRKIIPVAFAGGHICLVLLVARGRLLDEAPVGKRWTDVATVLGAQWVGPLWWYYEWRKLQDVGCPAPKLQQGSAHNSWFCLLAALAVVSTLLVVWRLFIAGLL